MKELHLKALQAYISMLTIHIDTKAMDSDFHAMTEEFYETLFEVAHKIWEKHIDLNWSLESSSLEVKKIEANKIIQNLKRELESYVKDNDITLGTEDLFGSLANDLEDAEWSSRAFL